MFSKENQKKVISGIYLSSEHLSQRLAIRIFFALEFIFMLFLKIFNILSAYHKTHPTDIDYSSIANNRTQGYDSENKLKLRENKTSLLRETETFLTYEDIISMTLEMFSILVQISNL